MGNRRDGVRLHLTLNKRANTAFCIANDFDAFHFRMCREMFRQKTGEFLVINVGRQAV